MSESTTPRTKQIITNLRYWWGHPEFHSFAVREIGTLETELTAALDAVKRRDGVIEWLLGFYDEPDWKRGEVAKRLKEGKA